MPKKIEPGSADDVAFDPKGVGLRYHKKPATILQHWSEQCAFPKPDFFAGRTPYWRLSTLLAWEESRSESRYRRADRKPEATA